MELWSAGIECKKAEALAGADLGAGRAQLQNERFRLCGLYEQIADKAPRSIVVFGIIGGGTTLWEGI